MNLQEKIKAAVREISDRDQNKNAALCITIVDGSISIAAAGMPDNIIEMIANIAMQEKQVARMLSECLIVAALAEAVPDDDEPCDCDMCRMRRGEPDRNWPQKSDVN